jgi:4-amino-4-deoxy-L-arabinose transferase-like glycosyltransferase
VIVAVGAILRISQIHQSLFEDELWTWVGANKSFGGMFEWVRSDQEITPPLFTILAWASAKLGDPTAMIRLPSLLAGIAMIPLIYTMAIRTLGRRIAITAALLAALSPFLSYFAVEARAYGLVATLTAASTLAMLIALEADRPRWWWAAYGAFSCAAMYTHYTAVFVLAVQLGWLLWFFPTARRPALVANLLAGAVFLLWLPDLLDDFASPSQLYSGFVSPFSFTTFRVFTTSFGFANPWAGIGDFYGRGFEVILLAGLGAGLIGTVMAFRSGAATEVERRLRSRRRRFAGLFIALGLATPLGLAAASIAGNDQFLPRNLISSSAGLLIAVAWLVQSGPRALRLAATALVICSFAVGAVKTLEPHWQRADVRAAAAVIDADAQPDDVVLDAVWLAGEPGPGTNNPLNLTLDVNFQQPHRVIDAGSPEELRQAARAAQGHVLWVVGTPSFVDTVVGKLGFAGQEPKLQRDYDGILPTELEAFEVPAQGHAALPPPSGTT